eukprot:TRINITY_DN3414_c0_g7_i1.p1 TRINITY_DN3414_c0_g7~~TRINITY_DN3414_c0_g7_i1.p1  ORF type:complete len:289 (+),score=68.79 TRINITY_DN3414_c0_g7_i1:146-1012(+)
MSNPLGRTIGNYNVTNQFEGKQMFFGTEEETEERVVLKRYSYNAGYYLTEDERETLDKICHKNIVMPLDIVQDPPYTYIVYEYFPSISLAEYVREKGRLEMEEIREILIQVLAGYKELIKRNLLHRNIKPDNILIIQQDTLTAKLCDMEMKEKMSYAGELYTAPEISLKSGVFPSTADIWSLGAVLYFMANGKPPGKGVQKGDVPVKKDMASYCHDLIARCLEPDPYKRILFEEITKHSFVVEEPVKEPASAEEHKTQRFYDPWRVVKFIQGKPRTKTRPSIHLLLRY